MKKTIGILLAGAFLVTAFATQFPEKDKVASAVPPEPMIWNDSQNTL